jgi:hypothetical protein
MYFLRIIIFLLLFIISFSCKTRFEKQGWQRTAIVSQLDTSTINKKYKELVVVKIQNYPDTDSVGKIINKPFLVKDKRSIYVFNVFVRDSAGRIINEPFPVVPDASTNSDLAYYKWESDSVCLVKILNHGKVEASFELNYNSMPWGRSLRLLDEPKK